MRHFILTLCLVLACTFAGNAQTTYSFGYDDAGNRETRAVILLKNAGIVADTLQAKQAEKPLEDLIGNRAIKIYPNPTKGLLRVQVPPADGTPATLQVFTLRGALLRKARVIDEFSEIDLSGQPAGMYILRISVGDQSSEWKVIKE